MAGSLDEALACFQAELPIVEKKLTAHVKSERTGAEFQYQYADLAACYEAGLPRLGKLGLAFTAAPTLRWVKPDPEIPGHWEFGLDYALRHVSGQQIGGWWPLPDPGRFDAQAIGRAITYARRYCFCAVTGIAPRGDEDGAHSPESGERKLRPSQKAGREPERKEDGGATAGLAQMLADKAAALAQDPQSTADQLARLVQIPAERQRQLGAQVTDPVSGEQAKLSMVIAAARTHIESRQGADSERTGTAG